MRNPLQEQLLKAGLVKKAQVAKAVREQVKQREGKAPAAAGEASIRAAQQLQVERAERDRELAAQRNAQARAAEQRGQVRQIIESHKLPQEGEISYRFADGDVIRSVLVTPALRAQLASGTLVIARHDGGYALLPRAAADKVHARSEDAIVLDHGHSQANPNSEADDDYYKQFMVPDDLIW
jgi:uncharacterized protein YaiL (DUF2058 family)